MREKIMITALQPLPIPPAEKIPELRIRDSASLFSNGKCLYHPLRVSQLTCPPHHTLPQLLVCNTIHANPPPPHTLTHCSAPRTYRIYPDPTSLSRVISCTPVYATNLQTCKLFPLCIWQTACSLLSLLPQSPLFFLENNWIISMVTQPQPTSPSCGRH